MIEDKQETLARHIEAYIRLEAATCEKMFRQGLGTAIWHDQHGEYCGTVWVRNISSSQIVIAYSSLSPQSSGSGEGQVLLPLERAATNPNYHKPYFLCRDCARRSGQLVLAKEKWACRKCHGFTYRSQRLGPAYRKEQRSEELFELLRPVGGQPSRPRYMRAERFAALVTEYETLRAELREKPRMLPEHSLRLALKPSWRSSSEPWVI
ncbi:hypothetical protein SAMN06297468_2006 [Altererythrobacter xiamenensis]|uniref:Uncharacterized protein n=1 Tax=Altererythrobacter xiamenensis TaxID=1316679 RepID=A0A1Y6F4L1_9SPHN|nr:hypothetical protein [Altererythrobacter xiamenensis]SMQ69824.1 hypothetical protein SAMN06297468_2006 [Altererythrobacter xiamenensis]